MQIFNQNKLQELYNQIKDGCYDIELGGSAIIPYIRTPDDYDLIIFAKTEEDRTLIKQLIIQYSLQGDSLRAHYGFCIKVEIAGQQKPLKRSTPFLIMYQQKGRKVLIGTSPKPNLYYNTEQDVLQHLNEGYNYLRGTFGKYYYFWLSRENDLPVMHTRMAKTFYHYYMNMCIIQNQSFELTNEQIIKLNIMHDVNEHFIEVLDELKIFFRED